jgi:ppGpp synthetase/RelA/SpoT-type nucleotidyltranferase
MGLLEQNLEKIQLIVDQFKDVREDTYENTLSSITSKLEKIIDELAEPYKLLTKNSVRDIKHFRFSTRVKEVGSLHEKFVRGNLLPKFREISTDKLKANDGVEQRVTKQILLEIDDIIGIKILTDLICDCENVYKLLLSEDFKNKAIAQEIVLDEEELKMQPVTMKNGLPIYKVKGRFEDKYNFELQIKSKLISAWGDMEHSIFYKDYAISPVRDTAQKSMNHVGKLLFDIDAFVESIRKADKDYAINAKALIFMDWMETNYSSVIRKKLGDISFNIGGISQLLYSIRHSGTIKGVPEIIPLRFDHFGFEVSSEKLEKYVASRNDVFELQILEAITLSWLLKSDDVIREENVDEILEGYLNLIIESTAVFLSKELSGKDLDEMKEITEDLHDFGLENKCNEKFLLDLKKMALYLNETVVINDFGEGEISDESILLLKNFLFIFKNEGDIDFFIESKEDISWEMLQKSILTMLKLIPKESDVLFQKGTRKELEKMNELVKSKL